jgi:hypothetical protein
MIMKKPQEIIDQLSIHDAIAVLKALADSDAQLAGRIAEIATEQLMGIDPDEGDVSEYRATYLAEIQGHKRSNSPQIAPHFAVHNGLGQLSSL